MAKIIGIAGSLRKGSYNAALLRAAVDVAPEGFAIEIASIREIPLYDGDVEATFGIPASVAALKDAIAKADGLLLATPEYNNSIPGVLKNAIDWLSRPPKDMPRVFVGKPVALIGTTPGGGLTLLSQAAWLPIFRTLGTRPFFGGRVAIGHASKVFDAEGHLIDEKERDALTKFVAGFAAFVAK